MTGVTFGWQENMTQLPSPIKGGIYYDISEFPGGVIVSKTKLQHSKKKAQVHSEFWQFLLVPDLCMILPGKMLSLSTQDPQR